MVAVVLFASEVSHILRLDSSTSPCYLPNFPKGQQVFLEKVDKLFQVFTDMCNSFKKESRDLLSLDTNDIVHPSAAELIFTHHDRGRTCFMEFMDGLESEVSTFYEPIKKLEVFRQEPLSVDATKQNVLKDECPLFSELFISCQSKNATCVTSFVAKIIQSCCIQWWWEAPYMSTIPACNSY